MKWSLSAFGADAIDDVQPRARGAADRYAGRSCGLHISDDAIKWLALAAGEPRGRRVEAWGEMPLSAGAVQSGVVHDARALVEALRTIKPHLGKGVFVHAALPVGPVAVFSMHVPRDASPENTRALIEFECASRTSMRPSAAFYSFERIPERSEGGHDEVGIVLYPREISESYAAALQSADIKAASFELETRAAARAVFPHGRDRSVFLVDIGRTQGRIALVKHGVPVFTSAVQIGTDAGYAALPAEIAHVLGSREAQGIAHGALIDAIVLVGECATASGLSDRIAGHARVPVEYGNTWRLITDFNDYIPPIDRDASLGFAVCAGLALRES